MTNLNYHDLKKEATLIFSDVYRKYLLSGNLTAEEIAILRELAYSPMHSITATLVISKREQQLSPEQPTLYSLMSDLSLVYFNHLAAIQATEVPGTIDCISSWINTNLTLNLGDIKYGKVGLFVMSLLGASFDSTLIGMTKRRKEGEV